MMETMIENTVAQGDHTQGDSSQELKLKNQNNCLACDVFSYIQKAPARPIVEADFEKVFFTWHEGKEIFFKMISLVRYKFGRMPDGVTLSATGLEAVDWCFLWRKEHPDVTDDSMMAVYYYKKFKR